MDILPEWFLKWPQVFLVEYKGLMDDFFRLAAEKLIRSQREKLEEMRQEELQRLRNAFRGEAGDKVPPFNPLIETMCSFFFFF